MIERGGKLVAHKVANVQGKTILPIIDANVEKGTQVYTDEFKAYNPLVKNGYEHGVVPHK